MCGIFGLVQKGSDITGKIIKDLFLLSELRGREASGFALKGEDEIKVFKTPFSASELVKTEIFKNEFRTFRNTQNEIFTCIGHSRLVTNGYEQFDYNNQPVVKNGLIVIHNGIIVNESELWQKYNSTDRFSDLDSELIPTIITKEYELNKSFTNSVKELFNSISGMTNIAILSNWLNNLILATNNGSIFYIDSLKDSFFVFASERFILEQIIKKHKHKLKLKLSSDIIKQLNPGSMISINLGTLSCCLSTIGDELNNLETNSIESEIAFLKDDRINKKIHLNTSLDHSKKEVSRIFIDENAKRETAIGKIIRCSKCLLPATFPYIKFDDKGVCNFCNNYHKNSVLGEEPLFKIAETFRRKQGRECLVPFSGGRDSSFALHYIVNNLKLKPIAFSYDWGMLTDLGRRNQARMCGSLGVEHILVSADIRKKRDNIRKNVLAWLNRPDLGTIPLFMAGDKQYFYFANLLMKQNNLELSILGENQLETTYFKSGFCGIKPTFKKGHTYSLSPTDKFKLMCYYGKQYLLNPAFINSSVFDTLDSFKSYYLIKHRNLNIFDYIKWNEEEIGKTIINQYKWEIDPGTRTTWRIGDGTAAFYNYIYYTVAGFTENDTFRSNQILEGELNREQALKLAIADNKPRWDSIQWYCRTIGIDFKNTIEVIHKIKPLYESI